MTQIYRSATCVEPTTRPAVLPFAPCRTATGRWLTAAVILLIAFATRWSLDGVADSGPFLTFVPAIALTTLLCGRWPAVAVIGLAVVGTDYYWLPPPGFAMDWPTTPVSLLLFLCIALFELTLIDTLCRSMRERDVQHDRLAGSLRLHETKFQEMRHRVANQMQVIAAMLEGSQMRIEGGARTEDVLEQAIGRISSIGYLQRLLDDPATYRRGFAEVLRDMLDHIFYDVDVAVQVRAVRVDLSAAQMTIISLIVIEAAMNALKHIFRRRRGHIFAVELRSLSDNRITLTIWDDGPGFDAGSVIAGADGTGIAIMRGLAAELGGTLNMVTQGGTTVEVEFAYA